MKTKNEIGRSMVEMLGVLAVIGVLSIGGIAGYSLGINRYRSNQLLDLASKLHASSVGGSYSGTRENNDYLNTKISVEPNGRTCVDFSDSSLPSSVQETFKEQVRPFDPTITADTVCFFFNKENSDTDE